MWSLGSFLTLLRPGVFSALRAQGVVIMYAIDFPLCLPYLTLFIHSNYFSLHVIAELQLVDVTLNHFHW
jgi:hypothetical protein